jgi:hypothetical protein
MLIAYRLKRVFESGRTYPDGAGAGAAVGDGVGDGSGLDCANKKGVVKNNTTVRTEIRMI